MRSSFLKIECLNIKVVPGLFTKYSAERQGDDRGYYTFHQHKISFIGIAFKKLTGGAVVRLYLINDSMIGPTKL